MNPDQTMVRSVGPWPQPASDFGGGPVLTWEDPADDYNASNVYGPGKDTRAAWR